MNLKDYTENISADLFRAVMPPSYGALTGEGDELAMKQNSMILKLMVGLIFPMCSDEQRQWIFLVWQAAQVYIRGMQYLSPNLPTLQLKPEQKESAEAYTNLCEAMWMSLSPKIRELIDYGELTEDQCTFLREEVLTIPVP